MDIPPNDPGENRWRDYAACASRDDHSNYHDSRRQHPRCDTCPASEPCLWFGLANEQDAGYRYGCSGGTTPARRARIAAGLGDVDYRQWHRLSPASSMGPLRGEFRQRDGATLG